MKRIFLSAIVASALLFTLSSCGGEKLLTEEEMNQRIEDQSIAQMDSLTTVLTAECEAKFPQLVSILRDSMLVAKADADAAAKEASKKK